MSMDEVSITDVEDVFATPVRVYEAVKNAPGLQAFTQPDCTPAFPPLPSIEEAHAKAIGLYQAYENAICQLANEEDNAAGDKIDLDRSRNEVVNQYDPKALGSNEEARKAKIDTLIGVELVKYRARLRSVELLKCEVEVARIRCRMSDNTLRYIEASIMADAGERE